MGEGEPLIEAVEVAVEPPTSGAARQCLEQYFRELTDRFDHGYDPTSDVTAPVEDLVPPSGLFLVAWRDGRPIGCGGLKRIDASTGEIKRVWTAPAARGLGVARRVLDRLEGEAAVMGFSALRLDTNKALTEAAAFYRKRGYREVARFNDNPYANFWFVKRLDG